jgi:hypothetical protein
MARQMSDAKCPMAPWGHGVHVVEDTTDGLLVVLPGGDPQNPR